MQKNSGLLLVAVIGILLPLSMNNFAAARTAQDDAGKSLTPLQWEIEKQRQRLASTEVEDRREALMQLRSMQRAEASRVALPALSDLAAIVRATAAESVLSLPPSESVRALIPLLADKDEFVRQQAAYALGRTRSKLATAALIELLSDKKDSVRGAAAVALGQIADASAVISLAALVNSAAASTSKKSKGKPERNPFVLRAAVSALGQIRNPAALPTLILVLQDEKAEADVRREAATALGAIGDAAALPALNSVLMAGDPYLFQAAHQAIRKISRAPAAGGI
jgi:HEAT repeat protein